MNREEYMKCLRQKLRRLPKEDYNRAIEYFEEYFEDAGPKREQTAKEDLGTPDLAAESIIREFAVENAQKPEKNVKRSFSKVWVGVLAICAAPVGLPLAMAFAVVMVALIMVIVALIFAVFSVALALAVSSVPCILVSIWMMFVSPVNGVATLGMGLMGIGIGIWVVMGCVALCKWFLNLMTRLFGKIAKRGKNI